MAEQETKPYGALERKKPTTLNPDTMQIAGKVTTWVSIGLFVVGVVWTSAITYTRLTTVEISAQESTAHIDKLRMDAAKQEMVNLHSMQQSEQMLRALQRIEARIEELQKGGRQ